MAAFASSSLIRGILGLRPAVFQPIVGISSGSTLYARTPFTAKSAKDTKASTKKAPSTKTTKGKSQTAKETAPTKRPLTAFNLYMKERLQHRPADMSQRDYMAVAAKGYKELKSSEKSKFEKAAQPLRTEYDSEKKRVEDQRLKRPLNQFTLYVKDRMASRPKDVRAAEFVKIIAQDYRKLDEHVLNKYVTAAREAKAKYHGAKENIPREATRAPSAYNLFMQEQLLNRSEGDKVTDTMRKVAGEWKGLRPDLKQKFVDLAAEKKAKFAEKSAH